MNRSRAKTVSARENAISACFIIASIPPKSVARQNPEVLRGVQLVEESGTKGQKVTVIAEDNATSRAVGTYLQSVLSELGYDASVKAISPNIQFTYIQNTETAAFPGPAYGRMERHRKKLGAEAPRFPIMPYKQSLSEDAAQQTVAKPIDRAKRRSEKAFDTETMSFAEIVDHTARTDDVRVDVRNGASHIELAKIMDEVASNTRLTKKIAGQRERAGKPRGQTVTEIVNGTNDAFRRVGYASEKPADGRQDPTQKSIKHVPAPVC